MPIRRELHKVPRPYLDCTGMSGVAKLLAGANDGARDKIARLSQINTHIGWHLAIIEELRRDRASLNGEPDPCYDRFGDCLHTIASGIAGRGGA